MILAAKCQCNYVRYVLDAPYMKQSDLKNCDMTTEGLIKLVKERKAIKKQLKQKQFEDLVN
jgi:hypothetical protein